MEKPTIDAFESQTTSVVPRLPFPRVRNFGGRDSKRRTVPDPWRFAFPLPLPAADC
ncbi:MAG TPA: hypothetical protein VES61_08470 [Gaiellaceae bacterium]|nr:hypothetical protein [Gaiellaceae bacterium]